MPHERLQEFVVIDYTKEIVILATVKDENNREKVIGVGQYSIIEGAHTADVAFTVDDNRQNRGVGTELLNYLAYLAKGKGILAFTADVLTENVPMLVGHDRRISLARPDFLPANDQGKLDLL